MGDISILNLSHFLRNYKSQVFFETGLGGGGGIVHASQYPFQYIISTEIDEETAKRFESLKSQLPNNERIKVFIGKSIEVLDAILPQLHSVNSIIFWLDAHFPGEANGMPYDYEKDLELRLPLEKEIEIINKYRWGKNDVIIIDDNRIYEKRNYQDKSLDEIGLSHLSKYNNNLKTLLSRFDIYPLDLNTGYLICLPKKQRKFGIRMAGNESMIEETIKNYINNNHYDKYKYLEIGAAGAVTMKTIYEIFLENTENFEINGLDLPNGWSLDWSTINSFSYPLNIFNDGNLTHGSNKNEKANIYLESNPRKWLSNLQDGSLDICFIDGCHGKACVKADFEAIQSKIKKGGIVFFHDAGAPEQGTDWQGHCGENINVREGLQELGLLTSSEKWKFIGEAEGTRKIGGDGNSCVFIQKL